MPRAARTLGLSRWVAYYFWPALKYFLRLASEISPPSTSIRRLAPLADWDHYYSAPGLVYDETDLPLPSSLATLSSVVGDLGSGFSRTIYETCVDGACFTAPRPSDDDNPSLRQALNGSEAREWRAARQKEFENVFGRLWRQNYENLNPNHNTIPTHRKNGGL